MSILNGTKRSCKYQGTLGMDQMSYGHFGQDQMSCEEFEDEMSCACVYIHMEGVFMRREERFISSLYDTI